MSEEIEQPDFEEELDSSVEDTEESDVDADPEEDSGETDELENIDYEGKQYKLPKELKEALLRQADYTRKTQEVAQQRSEVENQRQQAEQAIKMVSQYQKEYAQLTQVDSQLERLSQLDWNAAINENPVEAMKLQAKFNELRMQREQIAGNINQIQYQTEQQRQAEIARQLQEGEAMLSREIPNWNADTKKAIVDTASKFGFKPQELQGITDPRMVKVLHAAMMHQKSLDKLQKPTPSKPVEPTKTVKSAKPAPRGLSDDLPMDEWIKRRDAELRKQGRR